MDFGRDPAGVNTRVEDRSHSAYRQALYICLLLVHLLV